MADALFGKIDPGGKLPMSFPRDTGQIPISYNELPTSRPFDASNKYTSRYLDVPNTPLYPFGYGRSYTTFSLSDLHVTPSNPALHGTVYVSATIKNTGAAKGDDVAQLYIHESSTGILEPVRKLEGLRRLTLAPGQSQTVRFTLDSSNLGYYNAAGEFVVEPGPLDVWLGDSSVSGLHGTFNLR